MGGKFARKFDRMWREWMGRMIVPFLMYFSCIDICFLFFVFCFCLVFFIHVHLFFFSLCHFFDKIHFYRRSVLSTPTTAWNN